MYKPARSLVQTCEDYEAPLANASGIFSCASSEQNPPKRKNTSHSSIGLRQRFSAKADEAGLTPLLLLVVLAVSSIFVAGGGLLVNDLKNKGLINFNLPEIKSLLYKQVDYLDAEKVNKCTVGGAVVGTVILSDGSFSAYRFIDGGVNSGGRDFNGETKINFLSGDSGLGTYADGTITPFYLKDGTKTVGVIMDRMIASLDYQGTSYAVKVLEGRVKNGKLVGSFAAQTFDSGYIIAGSIDDAGRISNASVTTGASKATEAQTTIAKNALLLFKQISAAFNTRYDTKVLAATTSSIGDYQVAGFNKPVFNVNTGTWGFAAPSAGTTGAASTAPSQNIVNYLQALNQGAAAQQGSLSGQNLANTIYQFLPTYFPPATVNGLTSVKSASSDLTVSTAGGVATLTLDLSSVTGGITNGGVTTAKLADSAVTSSKIAGNTIGTDKLSGTLTFGGSTLVDLSQVTHSSTSQMGLILPNVSSSSPSNPSSGKGYLAYDTADKQVLFYNGTAWGTVGSGTITSVTAGNGLSGGGSSGAVSLSINSTDISSCTSSSTQKIIWDSTNNRFTCGTDQTTGGSASSLSSITAALGANTISNADLAQTWNWSLTTANKTAFSFGESAASTATGNPYILGVSTLTGSTANPLLVTAGGTSNGIKVDTTGLLQAIGTGGIKATTLNGTTFAAPGAIGGTTPSTGAFTTLSATGALSASNFSGSSSGTNTGDQTITLTGDVTGSGTGSFAATIGSGAVTLGKMATLAANSIIGNNTGVSATPLALTASQVKTLLAISNTDVSGLGTIATQNSNSITITGGSINGTTVGVTTPSTGAFTTLSTTSYATVSASLALGNTNAAAGPGHLNISGNLTTGGPISAPTTTNTINGLIINSGALSGITTVNASGQITSTLATGTAPFVVASTTNVANLNASSLGGATFAAPGAIGGTTPGTGAFTTLSATGAITAPTTTNTINSLVINAGALSGITTISASGQVTSTVSTGTAPFVVASTTNVANLNASSLNGATFAVPGAIGGTTPGTGAFTTLSASGLISANGGLTLAANQSLTFTSGTGTSTQNYSNTTGTSATINHTNSASSGTNTSTVLSLAITGTANAAGSNTITGLNFPNVVAATNNTYNGITFGTGFNNYLTSGTVNLTAAGALSGVTTLGLSGAITGATATNTINGIIINAGAVSGVSTLGLSGAITGATATNTINGLIINSGALSGITTINASGQLTSTVATGTAPFVVASTTNVANLNASSLNGATFAAPGAIGSTTPGTGVFTTIGVGSATSPQGKVSIADSGLTAIGKSLFNLDQYENQDILTASASGVTKFTVGNAGALTLSGAISAPTTTNTINGLIINSSALSGITTINASGQITSTLATGTAPFVVASTTNVANLNASSLNGATFAAPGAIGGTTPGTGAFTTLSATGAISGATATNTINGLIINSGALSGISTISASGLISANGGLTLAANQNLTFTSGTGTLTQNYSNTTGTQATLNHTNSASSGTNTSTALSIAITGTANAIGSNTITGLNFPNVVAATNNTYNGITFGTGFNNYITSGTVNLTAAGALSGLTTLGLSGAITGATATNTINGLIINSGALSGVTTINASGQFTSTLATGTAPFVVASTTNVANLNASSLSGATFAAPGAIGGTTPGSGAFTTLSASSTLSANGGVTLAANQGLTLSSGTGAITQGYTNSVTGSAHPLTLTNSNASITAANVKGLDLSLVGATNANANANTITGINFGNVTPIANNAFNGITFGTGFNNFLTSGTINITAAGAITGATGLTLASGNFDQSASAGTFSTGTGAVSLNGLTTLAAGKALIITGGAGSPTATTGTVWYDTTTNKFKIVENGVVKILCNTTDLACGTGSGAALSGISAATAGNTINNGDNAQVWNWQLSTAAKTAFSFGENIASINGVGSQYILGISTLTGSTANPLIITAGGTANGVKVDTAGLLSAIGTGGIRATDLAAGTYANALTLSSATNSITAGTLTATGGTINGTTIGATTPGTGAFTTLSATGAITGPTATNTINGIIINAGAVSGVTTLSASGLISANGGLTLAANQNLIFTSGTGTLTQNYSNTTGTQASLNHTNSASSGTNTSTALSIAMTGTANAAGSNTITGLNFPNVTAATNNTFNGITFGTGFNNYLTSGTVNLTAAGALSGITTLGLSGAITGATATNTINGIIINSGAVSGVSTLGLSGAITGATATNTINGLIISSGALSGITTINASGQFTSTLVTGTAPFVVASTTNVANLNASSLNGATFAAPGAIGGTTPGTGAFTTLSATGAISGPTATNTINGIIINAGAVSGVTTLSASGLISANGGLTLAANQNLIFTSGTGTLTQNYSNTTGTQASLNHTNSASSGTNTSTALSIAMTGTANAAGSNTITGLNFPNVTAATNNTFNGITFGTGFNNYLTSGTINITAAGAASGLTTLGLSGAITGATATNTINGIIINSGAISGVSTLGLSGAITGATATNTINGIIINSGAVSSVTTLGASSTVTIGSGGNTYTFNPAAAPALAGTARPDRRMTLTPEFAGAVLTGTGTGTMTSDFCAASAGVGGLTATNTTVCNTSGDTHNYYNWTTTQGTAQTYSVYVKWRVPDNFSAWDTTNSIQAYAKRSDATNGHVNIKVFDTANALNNAGGTEVAGAANTWVQNGINISGGTWTAGSYITLEIDMTAAASGGVTNVGEINLNYFASN